MALQKKLANNLTAVMLILVGLLAAAWLILVVLA